MLNVRHPPEVHGQVGRAEVQEVEEAELQRHAAVTQHLQPVPLAALLEVPLVAALHLLLELGRLARAHEEGDEAEEEAVVGEAEDEAHYEGEERAAGGEAAPVVAPGHHQHRHHRGSHPAQGGHTEE